MIYKYLSGIFSDSATPSYRCIKTIYLVGDKFEKFCPPSGG
jgi:hypothetical protein